LKGGYFEVDCRGEVVVKERLLKGGNSRTAVQKEAISLKK